MDGSEKCETCDGHGAITVDVGRRRLDGTFSQDVRTCPDCSGTGVVVQLDVIEQAKRELQAAIVAYQRVANPDQILNGWTLVTHRRSTKLEQDGRSVVGSLAMTGQDWPLTIGMLTAALDAERKP